MLCTTDCSWPILKCLVECFNLESLEEYLYRSYKISSGNAEEKDLPVVHIKTFLHISLCHSMKAFSTKINKTFKTGKTKAGDEEHSPSPRNFIKFVMSLLANSGNLSDILEIVTNLFSVLLSKSNKNCYAEIHFLQSKFDDIELFKE